MCYARIQYYFVVLLPVLLRCSFFFPGSKIQYPPGRTGGSLPFGRLIYCARRAWRLVLPLANTVPPAAFLGTNYLHAALAAVASCHPQYFTLADSPDLVSTTISSCPVRAGLP